jgi:hypothetical protein
MPGWTQGFFFSGRWWYPMSEADMPPYGHRASPDKPFQPLDPTSEDHKWLKAQCITWS